MRCALQAQSSLRMVLLTYSERPKKKDAQVDIPESSGLGGPCSVVERERYRREWLLGLDRPALDRLHVQQVEKGAGVLALGVDVDETGRCKDTLSES